MDFKKGTVIVILFIVVVSAVLGFMAWRLYPINDPVPIKYAQNPTPECGDNRDCEEGQVCMKGACVSKEAAGWETYINEEYNFEFKYPSNRYELKETSISSNKFKVFLEENSTTKSTARGITVIENKKFSDLTSSLNIVEKEKVVVDKKEGIRVKIRKTNGKGPEITESIFVEQEDNVFRFTWPVDSIVSTFEFIE